MFCGFGKCRPEKSNTLYTHVGKSELSVVSMYGKS